MRQGTTERMVAVQFPAFRTEDGKWSEKRDAPVKIKLSDLKRAQEEGGATIYRPELSNTQKWVSRAADLLPMVGGLAGESVGTAAGAIGGAGVGSVPLAIGGRMAGGGIGSGLGQAAREGIYRLAGMGDAPGTVLGETALGAGSSLVGFGAGKVASRAGEALMTSAVGRGIKAGPKVVKDMMQLGVTVSKKGLEKAQNIVDQTVRTSRRMMRNAPPGAVMPYKRLVGPLDKMIEQARKFPVKDTYNALLEVKNKLVSEIHPTTGLLVQKSTPNFVKEMVKLKRVLDREENAYWTSKAAGTARTLSNMTDEIAAKVRTSNQIRKWLNIVTPPRRVTIDTGLGGKIIEKATGAKRQVDMSLRTANQMVSRALAVRKAVQDGLRTTGTARLAGGGAGNLAGVGLGLGGLQAALSGDATGLGVGGGAGLLLQMSPNLASRVAIGLGGRVGQRLIASAPYVARQLMLGQNPFAGNSYGIASATGPAPSEQEMTLPPDQQ